MQGYHDAAHYSASPSSFRFPLIVRLQLFTFLIGVESCSLLDPVSGRRPNEPLGIVSGAARSLPVPTTMADSDGEYVEDISDDDEIRPGGGALSSAQAQVESNYGTRSKGEAPSRRNRNKKTQNDNRRRAAWEDMHRSWEDVIHDEAGGAAYTIDQLIDEEKRRRLLRDTTPLQRGIIRHLMLVIDMSFAMTEKDLLPTRYHLTLNYAVMFVREYFEQNPISQLGIVGMRDGVAVRISDMSGNPAEHIDRLRFWHDQETPSGNPSLQNALEMCRGALLYVFVSVYTTRRLLLTPRRQPATRPPTAPAKS